MKQYLSATTHDPVPFLPHHNWRSPYLSNVNALQMISSQFWLEQQLQGIVSDRDAEALAYLSAILTGFSLLMNFVLQKLGIVLSEKELAKLKETTLLKQVQALECLIWLTRIIEV